MEEQIKKFNLIDQDNALKVYFFTVQKGNLIMQIPEDSKAILAYNDEDAFNEVRKLYPINQVISITRKTFLEVKRLVDVLNLPSTEAQEVKPIIETPPSKEKTAQDFIYGMMLISDEFIKDKRDKNSIKRILNKIKINESPIALTPAPNFDQRHEGGCEASV